MRYRAPKLCGKPDGSREWILKKGCLQQSIGIDAMQGGWTALNRASMPATTHATTRIGRSNSDRLSKDQPCFRHPGLPSSEWPNPAVRRAQRSEPDGVSSTVSPDNRL